MDKMSDIIKITIERQRVTCCVDERAEELKEQLWEKIYDFIGTQKDIIVSQEQIDLDLDNLNLYLKLKDNGD